MFSVRIEVVQSFNRKVNGDHNQKSVKLHIIVIILFMVQSMCQRTILIVTIERLFFIHFKCMKQCSISLCTCQGSTDCTQLSKHEPFMFNRFKWLVAYSRTLYITYMHFCLFIKPWLRRVLCQCRTLLNASVLYLCVLVRELLAYLHFFHFDFVPQTALCIWL